jgi:general nucleoside transport system ATP-binding protein
MSGVALALEGISKRFGATHALSAASIVIRAGTIHALLGENGAGKTTLMRVAYGLVQPEQGVIRVDGRPMAMPNPAAAIRAGLGMVHQHFTIVPAMTVAENVALGGRGRFDPRAVAERVRAIGASTGIILDPDAATDTLGVSAQQQLEIIKALAHDARTLILDEPTAVLAPTEAGLLLRRLRALASDGLSVVLITHKLREALAVADDVTVLRRGSTVLAAPASSVSEGMLAEAMLGPEWKSVERSEAGAHVGAAQVAATTATVPEAVTGLPALAVDAIGISVCDDRGVVRVRTASLRVRGGEIVGIAGVEGSGVHELLRALGGQVSIASGVLNRAKDVAFVPEDRHREALVLDFSLTENVALRGAGTRKGIMPWAQLRERTRALLEDFDVRAASTEAPISILSGGNQQKLVLARELGDVPSLLIVENPTRGLDLRASAAIHHRLRMARDAGMAVIAYSSDLDELLALADRTFAMHAGVLVETARERDAIGQAMLGAVTGAGALEVSE